MSPSDRPSPFKAFLPPMQPTRSGVLPPPMSYLVRCTLTDSGSTKRLDGLDAFILACAGEELLLSDLLQRLPCSRALALTRVQELVEAGSLMVRPSPEAAASDLLGLAATDSDQRETLRPAPSGWAPERLGRETRPE